MSILGLLSLLMLLMLIYFVYARYKLSPNGGDFQSVVSGLVTEKVEESASGRLLDIGCGSGILSVELAQKCHHLRIDGIDYWGGMWGYAKGKCENLAKENQVADRVCFTKASALSLPFDDKTFDIVISNMVFHEVADAKDKRDVIKEALRVLKKGGTFVLQDVFLSQKLYGKPENLIQFVKDNGVETVSLIKAADQIHIPTLLNSPLFFGHTAMLYGKK